MRSFLSKILPKFPRSSARALTGVALLGVATSALPPQRVINGLYYPTSAQYFFREGQQKFDREIERLTQGKLSTADERLLEINQELRKHKDILRLEHPDSKPGGAGESGSQQ
ncbi:hypothetical protein [Kamptonema formosum]|uniref:hypothetical protein n=1 Tax=Kamptonema formosum TaxID=331992 RepID=UPI0003450AED|nr:hypothetical protein [Oscillatoria sp. PCC 10802]